MKRLTEVILFFAGVTLLIWLLLPFAGDNPIKRLAIIWVINIWMLAMVWLFFRLRKQSFSSIGLKLPVTSDYSWPQILSRSVLVAVLGLIAFMAGAVIMAGITGMPEQADMSQYGYLFQNPLWLVITLLGVYIVSSFGEEVIYRGYLITRITEIIGVERFEKPLSIVVSSVIFGLAHYSWGPTGMVQTFFMGAVMAFYYWKFQKNLWILILAHAYMDTLLIVQMYLTAT